MVDNSLMPFLIVLTPILGTVTFVAIMIKRYLDNYIPLKVIVRHKGDKTELIIQTKRKTTHINVGNFRIKEYREVLGWRINGLEFGRYRLGEYKGKYGEVVSYAISDSGLLIDDIDGKIYYLAFNNIHEVVDAILDKNIKEKVIEVRK
ncbi:MAG TPA: hypothetical protein EYH13_03830 [Thermococcus paralvinellae]|uniref:Bacterial Pleckstrin homology domain-containing protein n=1 Tax=Thermococcus paralvinellae TaxID=582419 RepID=A0A832Z9F6_9EURY|nr:hypothetical protein [Thermococcus paralvinellae]